MTQPSDIAWSHSALKSFTDCPLRYHAEKVTKEIKFDNEAPHIKWGNAVHKAMELRLRDRTPLPGNMPYEKWAAEVERVSALAGLTIDAETEMAFDNQWQPCGWFSKGPRKTWMRCKADIFAVRRATGMALVVDWKTGKYRGDDGQARVNAAATMLFTPEVNHVAVMFVYLESEQVIRSSFDRSQLNDLLTPSLQTLNDISRAYTSGVWPPKPSGLCRFCPLTRCSHHPDHRK